MLIGTIVACNDARAEETLLRLLNSDPDFTILDHCRSREATAATVRSLQPDLVVLDLDMEDCDPAELVEEAGAIGGPSFVFLSTSEDCVTRAFESGAVDGLVKPVTDQRFREAALRVKYELQSRGPREASLTLSGRGSSQRENEPIIVRSGSRVLFLRPDEIVWVQAAANYLRFHTATEMHVVRGTISALEAYLERRRFLRIHRSLIVNTDWLKELVPCGRGEYVLRLTNGRELPIGRCYQERIEAFLSCSFSARAR